MTALALAVLALAQTPAEPLTAEAYRRRLAAVADALERDDLETVRAEARGLLGRRVRHEGMEVASDASLLEPLAEASDPKEARALRLRLEALMAALERLGPPEPSGPPDRGHLERVLREEALRDPTRGGEPIGPQLHVPRSLQKRAFELAQEIYEALGRVLRWIWRLIFGFAGGGGAGDGASMWTTLLIIGLVAILGLAAALALRRLRAEPAVPFRDSVPEVRPSEKDEDPLSRTANEWERFAAELLRAGRFREAIRAGYHAALVSHFRAGLLHYRKDRTNWEYAFALPPDLPWRPVFLEATRTFEREWYGRRASDAETTDRFMAQVAGLLTDLRAQVRR